MPWCFVTALMEQGVIGTITENLRFFPTLVGLILEIVR